MVENMQCPVCTLFLHAGMNLSDHLETHPKEQVIKALVQMTITGGGPGTIAVTAALADDEKPNVETTSKASTNEKEHEISTNSTSNSSSSIPSTTSTNNSLNLSFCTPKKQENVGFATTHSTTGKHIFNQQNVTSSPAYQKSGEPHGIIGSCINNVGVVRDITQTPTDFSTISSRYQHQQQQTSSQLHQQHVAATQQRPPPPPPPPLPHLPQHITQLANSGGSHGFQALPQQQPPMLAHQHQNSTHHQHHTQQNQHQQQQQNHHRQQHASMPLAQQQNLKIIYSSTLPPPPPLQLFSYQPSTQPQHQKPPPAYGTAISQIRSQHNQNKQTLQQQHQMQQRTASLSAIAPTSKHETLKQNLPPTPLAAAAPIQQQKQYQHQETVQQQQTQQQFAKNFAANNTSLPKTTETYQQRVQTPTTTVPLTIVATPPVSRQTASPYPAIISAAAIASPSSSSVLRYAESPVTAHYLERENGDFIVQEIPKHIVECVEKDNGEFSVIERIHQSPPSVLHIHDDDDEDDNIEDGSDNASDGDGKIFANEETANKSIKDDEKNNEQQQQEDDEEFMSVDSDNSDMEDSLEKSFPKASVKLCKDNATCSTPLEQTIVNSAISSKMSDANSNSNSNSTTTTNNNSGLTPRKKSSKNTITVLSDVQLNLNEYLDLVGNIIASSKIAQNRNTFSDATAAIPLLKVEKVEPYDEYEQNEIAENMTVIESVRMEATSLMEPPKTTNNKDNITETDELIANKFNSNKSSLNETYINKVATTTASEESKLHEKKNVAAKCSGHATSVIRMATTNTASQPILHENDQLPSSVVDIVADVEKKGVNHSTNMRLQQEKFHNAEDLSQAKIKNEVTTEDILQKTPPPPIQLPPLKKGPKKLVIKPKLNKTDANNVKAAATKTADDKLISDEQPTTSAKAQQKIQLDKIEQTKTMEQAMHPDDTDGNVVIKCEPYSITEQTSILEQHLKQGLQQLEFKEEQSSARNDTIFSLDSQKIKIKRESDEFSDVPNIYTDSNEEEYSSCVTLPNVTEDARVLLNFANSKKSKTDAASTTVSFPSSNSIFAGSLIEKSISTNATCSSSSTQNAAGTSITTVAANFSTSNSASAAALSTLRCDDEFIVPDATDVQEIVISSSYSSQSATDIALNNCNNVTVTDQHQHNFSDYPFSFLYGGGSVAQQIETKGNFSPIYQHQPHDATTAATLASGSNSVTIEEFTPVQNSSQHQQQQRYHAHAPVGAGQWYHAVSTSNADFEAALAVDCGDAENDVGKYLDLDSCKRDNMTAAQAAPCSSTSSFAAATESSLAGCTTDALNIRTDEKMPAKGEISEQESNCDIENSWSQPMYGDIPARFFKTSFPGLFPQDNWNGEEYFTVHDLSASAGTTSASNRATKSFDFRLPMETTATTTAAGVSMQQQQCTEHLPSSSKKKRKRDSNIAKSSTATSRKVAATVTSQDLFLQQQRQQQHQQQQLQFYNQQPTTSAAILAGPSTAAAASSSVAAATAAAAVIQKQQRKKIYQCAHCPLQYTKLKDRNSHMIVQHNYVRQNRRLVSLQTVAAATVTTATATTASAENLATIPFNGASGSSNILTIPLPNFVENIEDSKQGIVKIEMENNADQAVASMSTVENIMAKSELVDDKDSLALMPTTSSTPNAVVDLKPPNVRPLALTHAAKLATLYRMLVSFNISTLKQNSNISEVDEKLMESCIFFCYVCRQNFNTVKFYDAHLTEHPAECFTCGKKFQRWKNFSLHLKRHLGWKEFGCNVCDKKFVVRSALVEHMRMHTGLTPLKCKICGKNFKRYSNLTQHRKRHGRQILRKKEFVCHCGEVLPSKARFLWHKETHDAKPKCCPYCCDRFVHANSLRRHIRLAHSDKFDYTEPMECPMCKQVFAKSSIRAHMATHSMDTQHDCPICNKSFSTKWNLKIHSWVHANRTAKPFKCEHCPKAFVREVDFKNHMNAHKQIKPYTCEYCGCKFIRKYNYMRHRREHHGNKKFTCDLCKKSFHRHYYLIEHRRIHTGERPFQCTICGKSSTTKTNHNKHLKIHHSRDPFTVEA